MNIHKRVNLNFDVRGIGQSATLAINERVKALQRDGRTIYNLGLGQSPFPVPTEVVNALKHHAHEKDYLPVKGLPELRNAVAEFHNSKDQVNVRPDDVLIGPGSKELLFLLQLSYYGELVVPSPCWVSYVPQAEILGRKVRLIHTSFEDRWQITPAKLREFCESEHDTYRPRILVLNYPGNPDGLTYPAEELEQIAKVAKEFEILLLSDEIYGQINHAGAHVSVARYYPEGTIISSGLSKWCGAGGWRLGTFSFPRELDWLQEAMACVASETYTSVSAPIQFAAVSAFKGGIAIERYLAHARRMLKATGNRCASILATGGIRVHPPEGAFYLFLDFSPFADELARRGIKTAPELCERLLAEASVAILPGMHFGREAEDLTARMAYVNFDGARVLSDSEAVPLDSELPASFIERHCRMTIGGVEKIVEWLHAKGA
ncbi:MAG: aminotransferase class I/II-fold pyridoxal phosphate-dependent enzyme [Methanobacteriota archaeon]